METYQILDIQRGTSVDGPGLRTSIYLAGCTHRCQGCHNPDSWAFDGGVAMTLEEIMAVVEEEDFDVTLTGGDPLQQPQKTARLAAAIRSSGKNIWLYTGYTFEEILCNPQLLDAIKDIDTIVDGPFIEELRDADLTFRGSSNQRIIDVKSELAKNSKI